MPRHRVQRETPSRTNLLGLILLFIVALLACSGENQGPALEITGAWARPMEAEVGGEGPGVNSAVYLEIRNQGGAADRLAGGETPAAARLEVHETVMEGDVARMREVGGVDLPAGVTVTLKPGGLHLMLLGLKESLRPGDTLSLTLNFVRSPSRTIRVPVRGLGAG